MVVTMQSRKISIRNAFAAAARNPPMAMQDSANGKVRKRKASSQALVLVKGQGVYQQFGCPADLSWKDKTPQHYHFYQSHTCRNSRKDSPRFLPPAIDTTDADRCPSRISSQTSGRTHHNFSDKSWQSLRCYPVPAKENYWPENPGRLPYRQTDRAIFPGLRTGAYTHTSTPCLQ